MQAVVDVMARVKAGTTPKVAGDEHSVNDSQPDADAPQSQGSQPDTEAACPPAGDEDDFMPVNVIESEEEQEDPVLAKARELMALESTS